LVEGALLSLSSAEASPDGNVRESFALEAAMVAKEAVFNRLFVNWIGRGESIRALAPVIIPIRRISEQHMALILCLFHLCFVVSIGGWTAGILSTIL
jgi:hypothetical protein